MKNTLRSASALLGIAATLFSTVASAEVLVSPTTGYPWWAAAGSTNTAGTPLNDRLAKVSNFISHDVEICARYVENGANLWQTPIPADEGAGTYTISQRARKGGWASLRSRALSFNPDGTVLTFGYWVTFSTTDRQTIGSVVVPADGTMVLQTEMTRFAQQSASGNQSCLMSVRAARVI